MDTHIAEESVASKTNQVEGKPVRITITLPTNAYFMTGIRDFVMTTVSNMTGFSMKWAHRFQSIVDELVNNAIEFGSAPEQEIKVTLISLKDRYIEVHVEDTGTGAQKKTAKELNDWVEEHKKMDPTQMLGLRGRGLAQIVASWTDVLEFIDNEKGGITARVAKELRPEEQESDL